MTTYKTVPVEPIQEMNELPPLPEPEELGMDFDKGWDGVRAYGYTADQMREYGKARERAAYERAAQLCEERAGTVSMFASSKEAGTHNRAVRGCAAAIRALGADK